MSNWAVSTLQWEVWWQHMQAYIDSFNLVNTSTNSSEAAGVQVAATFFK